MNEPKLKPLHREILLCRTNSTQSFSQTVKDTISDCLEDLVLRICAISGIGYPLTEKQFDYFIEELIILLDSPKYNNLSIPEIILAFRINSRSGVKYVSGEEIPRIEIFGTSISVDYIERVLNNYFGLRTGIENEVKCLIDGYN